MCGILHSEMAEESPCLELLVDVRDSEPREGRGLADPLQSWPALDGASKMLAKLRALTTTLQIPSIPKETLSQETVLTTSIGAGEYSGQSGQEKLCRAEPLRVDGDFWGASKRLLQAGLSRGGPT